VDRAFARKIAAEANKLAGQYQIVLVFEDDEWFGHGLELPMVYGDGKTPQACVASTRKAMTASVATMLESGQRPPVPARRGIRSEQVNVRLTPAEKAFLTTSAQAQGFRGLSDFLRASAIALAK